MIKYDEYREKLQKTIPDISEDNFVFFVLFFVVKFIIVLFLLNQN